MRSRRMVSSGYDPRRDADGDGLLDRGKGKAYKILTDSNPITLLSKGGRCALERNLQALGCSAGGGRRGRVSGSAAEGQAQQIGVPAP